MPRDHYDSSSNDFHEHRHHDKHMMNNNNVIADGTAYGQPAPRPYVVEHRCCGFNTCLVVLGILL
jgi:hypothetical protein